MGAFNERRFEQNQPSHYCVYAGRRDIHNYVHTHEEIMERYAKELVLYERLPIIWNDAMGSETYTAHAYSKEALDEFVRFVLEQKA